MCASLGLSFPIWKRIGLGAVGLPSSIPLEYSMVEISGILLGRWKDTVLPRVSPPLLGALKPHHLRRGECVYLATPDSPGG